MKRTGEQVWEEWMINEGNRRERDESGEEKFNIMEDCGVETTRRGWKRGRGHGGCVQRWGGNMFSLAVLC